MTFTRKSLVFQNRNYFFFIRWIRLSTVTTILTYSCDFLVEVTSQYIKIQCTLWSPRILNFISIGVYFSNSVNNCNSLWPWSRWSLKALIWLFFNSSTTTLRKTPGRDSQCSPQHTQGMSAQQAISIRIFLWGGNGRSVIALM